MERPVRTMGSSYRREVPPVVASGGMTTPPKSTGGRPVTTGLVQKERGMLRVDDETWERLNAAAAASGIPRAALIRKALVAFLDSDRAVA